MVNKAPVQENYPSNAFLIGCFTNRVHLSTKDRSSVMRFIEESTIVEQIITIINDCDKVQLQISFLKLLKTLIQNSKKIRDHFNLINGYDFLQASFIDYPYLLTSISMTDFAGFFTMEVKSL